VEWIHLAQDKDQWWALVNPIIEPSCSIKGGKFFERLLAAQEGCVAYISVQLKFVAVILYISVFGTSIKKG
jgi:hypothetical protein